MVAEWKGGKIALAHNGNLVNARELRRELEGVGDHLEAPSDSEVMLRMIAREADDVGSVEGAIKECMPKWTGAYSLTILTETAVMAVRDPYGVRPLCLGRLNGDTHVFASESCALRVIGAELTRDVSPGELVVADEDGVRGEIIVPSPRQALCVFEYIYMARPDSHIDGHL